MKAQDKYLLDTNICVFLLRGKYNIDEYIKDVGIESCFLSEITIAELVYGAYCSKDVENKLIQINNLRELFGVLTITDSIETYARIKNDLRTQGLPVDDFDLLIAATAIQNDLTLVSDNTKHFNRIPLKLINWVNR